MARKKRITIHQHNDVTVLDMGEMEIWDGADLALLRETLTQLVDIENHHSLGVDMTFVKYIPSGFFGMLYDWHQKGAAIRLYTPKAHVQNMLWFRQFFDHVGDGCFKLLTESKQPYMAAISAGRANNAPWKTSEKVVAPTTHDHTDHKSVAAT